MCDNEDRRRQCRLLDEEGNEGNTNQGRWLAFHPIIIKKNKTNTPHRHTRLQLLCNFEGPCDWKETKCLHYYWETSNIIKSLHRLRVWKASWEKVMKRCERVSFFVCLLYWLLHRWEEGSVHWNSAHLQTYTCSWCTRPHPTVHWSDTSPPGENTMPQSLQHTCTNTQTGYAGKYFDQARQAMLFVPAGSNTLAFMAAFPWNLHLFLAIHTKNRWTLFNAALNVTQLKGKTRNQNTTSFKPLKIASENLLTCSPV